MYQDCGLEHLDAAQSFWLGVGVVSPLVAALVWYIVMHWRWHTQDKREEPSMVPQEDNNCADCFWSQRGYSDSTPMQGGWDPQGPWFCYCLAYSRPPDPTFGGDRRASACDRIRKKGKRHCPAFLLADVAGGGPGSFGGNADQRKRLEKMGTVDPHAPKVVCPHIDIDQSEIRKGRGRHG